MTSIKVAASRQTKAKFAAIRSKVALAEQRAINHTGDKARTQVRIAMVTQTGLKRKTINKAVRSTKGSVARPTYVIRSRGGNIRLEFFGAKETRQGVSAAPHGKRTIFAGTFMKGGRFPKRVAFKKQGMKGHVFRRKGRSRLGIQGGRSGVYIPTEMTQGNTLAAFDAVVRRDLPARIQHELQRIVSAPTI